MTNFYKTVLITGGAGFIGANLVKCFINYNPDLNIVVLDRLDSTVYPERLANPEIQYLANQDRKRLKVVWWDLKSELNHSVSKSIGEVDYILHLAASSHVDRSISNPLEFVEDNVIGTTNILNFARKQPHLDKFVLFSTDEVFGSAKPEQYFTELDTPNPVNPYAASKAAAENIAHSYAATYNLPIFITRCMNVLGEYQHYEKFLPTVIRSILNKETLLIHSDPTRTKPGERYYLDCFDVYKALITLITFGTVINKDELGSGIYHLVGNAKLNNLELAQLICKAIQKEYLGTDLKYILNYSLIDYHSSRPYHDLLYQLSGEKMKKLGWVPSREIKETVSRTVKWYLSNREFLC